jgi:hypothetical protein
VRALAIVLFLRMPSSVASRAKVRDASSWATTMPWSSRLMRSSCAEWSARGLERPCLDGTVELDLQFGFAAKRDLKFVFRRRDPRLQLLEAVGTFLLATIAVRRRPVGSGW